MVCSNASLSHGYQTGSKKISKVSVFFESMPYQLDPASGTIDYDGVERSAALFRPKLIVAGASAYSRAIDYQRMQQVSFLAAPSQHWFLE